MWKPLWKKAKVNSSKAETTLLARPRTRLPQFRHILAEVLPFFRPSLTKICIAALGNVNMKPVTEDQVQSLLDGLEKREKEALQALAADAETLPMSGGRMTAKVLRFASVGGRGPVDSEMAGIDIVPLNVHRAKSRRRRASKGLFYYVASAGVQKPSH